VPTKLDALVRILAGAPRLWLDGVGIAISEEELRPVATLSDRSLDLSPSRGPLTLTLSLRERGPDLESFPLSLWERVGVRGPESI